MSSPTSRTLDLLRREGWTAGVVEKWIPQARKRRDLYGFADVAAVKAGVRGTLYIQATSGSNHSSRKAKLLKCAEVAIALAAENQVEVWSWRKAKRRRPSETRQLWTARREPLSLSDFVPQMKETGPNVPRETSQEAP